MFSSLSHRDFRMLLIGTMATQLGQWTQQVGLSWLVYTLTGSPLQLGIVGFASGCSMLIMSPVGGALVDRVDRKKLMMVSQSILMTVGLTLAVLVVTGHIRIWMIYVTSAISGMTFGVNGPTRQTVVYDLVGKNNLTNAVGVNSIITNIARVVGPALGGALLATVGIPGVFFFQAGGYMLAMVTTVSIRQDLRPQNRERTSFFKTFWGGFTYAKKNKVILMLLLAAVTATFFGTGFIQLLPAYAAGVLNLSGSGYGFMLTSFGAGALIGSVFIAVLGNFKGQGKLLITSLLALGLCLLALGLSHNLLLSILLLLGLGAANALWMALDNTLLQLAVTDEYRGRVMSLFFLTFGLQPFGSLPMGAAAEHIGIGPAIAIMGGLVTIAALFVTIAAPIVRKL